MALDESQLRRRQILVGGGILLSLAVVVCAMLTGWRYLPSPWGEWLGTIAGVMSTPFLMEGSFLILGFTLVVWMNHRKRLIEGEEWVDLPVDETKDGAVGRGDQGHDGAS